MPDTQTPVVVKANASLMDSIQAAIRYITFLIASVTAILGLLKAHDLAGLVAYIQASGGDLVAAISGLVALAIAGYGIFKTGKRGAQLVQAADAAPNNKAKVV